MGAFPFTKRFDGNEIIYLESINIDTLTVDQGYLLVMYDAESSSHTHA